MSKLFYILAIITLLLIAGCARDLPPEPETLDAVGNYYRSIGDWVTAPDELTILSSSAIVCEPEEDITLSYAIDGDAFTYEYAYLWNEELGKWEGYLISGSNAGNWIKNKGELNIQTTCADLLTTADANGELFVVVYSCSRVNDAWDCNGNRWQLEISTVEQEFNADSCSDNDVTDDVSLKGTVTGMLNGISYIENDVCSGDTLTQVSCEGTNIVLLTSFCDYGCTDGACYEDSEVPCKPGEPGCTALETCNDGILNQDEEKIDCGGLNCATCETVNDERFGMFVIYQMGTGTLLEEELKELNVKSTRTFQRDIGKDIKIENDRPELGIKWDVTIIPKNDWWENKGIRYLIDIGAIPEFQGHSAISGFPSDIDGYIEALKKDIEATDLDGVDDADISRPIDTLQFLNEPNWEWFGKLTLEEAKQIEEIKGDGKWEEGWKDPVLTGWRDAKKEAVTESYWELLKITSETAKEANPNLKIVLGRGMLETSDRKLVEKYLDYFDFVDVHFYGTYVELERQAKIFKEKFGYTGKPLVSYELGGPMKYDGLFNDYELGKHAEHVVQLHMVGFTNNIEKIYYASMSNIIGYNHEGFFNIGLIDDDGNKKPAYYTYKIMKEKIAGFTKITKIDENQYHYKVDFEDKPSVFVLWTRLGNSNVDLSEYYQGNVIVSHIVTEFNNGEPVYLNDEIVSGSSIPLSETPIFVTIS